VAFQAYFQEIKPKTGLLHQGTCFFFGSKAGQKNLWCFSAISGKTGQKQLSSFSNCSLGIPFLKSNWWGHGSCQPQCHLTVAF